MSPRRSTLTDKIEATQWAEGISEKDFQLKIIEVAKVLGWRVVHFREARLANGRVLTPLQGHAGFPDLVLAKAGTVIVAELKSQHGYVSLDQRAWLSHLGEYGRLWRPSDWDAIYKELTAA